MNAIYRCLYFKKSISGPNSSLVLSLVSFIFCSNNIVNLLFSTSQFLLIQTFGVPGDGVQEAEQGPEGSGPGLLLEK